LLLRWLLLLWLWRWRLLLLWRWRLARRLAAGGHVLVCIIDLLSSQRLC
jgi:hypothetical protein